MNPTVIGDVDFVISRKDRRDPTEKGKGEKCDDEEKRSTDH